MCGYRAARSVLARRFAGHAARSAFRHGVAPPAEVSARAGIEGGDKAEVGGIGIGGGDAGDVNHPIFKRLPQHIQ